MWISSSLIHRWSISLCHWRSLVDRNHYAEELIPRGIPRKLIPLLGSEVVDVKTLWMLVAWSMLTLCLDQNPWYYIPAVHNLILHHTGIGGCGGPTPGKFCHGWGRIAGLGPMLGGWCSGPSGPLGPRSLDSLLVGCCRSVVYCTGPCWPMYLYRFLLLALIMLYLLLYSLWNILLRKTWVLYMTSATLRIESSVQFSFGYTSLIHEALLFTICYEEQRTLPLVSAPLTIE